MYMYNLLFNFDNTDGLFDRIPDTTNPALQDLKSSNVWLEATGLTTTLANAETPTLWTDLGTGSTLYLPSNPNPGDLGIRIAPDLLSASPPSPAATLLVVVSFGRPDPSPQPQASPFTHNGNIGGRVLTTFVLPAATKNTTRGWYLKFGRIAKRPGHPKLAHRYQFSVGVILTDGTTVRHYGEDPEMDVGE